MANKLHDLMGQHFGRLIVIQLDLEKSKPNRKYWKCQCECGNIKSIRMDCLTRKKNPTLSCGCYNKEQLQKTNHHKDYTNQKFGMLTPIKPLYKYRGKGDNKRMIWLCKCDCGNFTEVTSQDFQSGHSKSCGCLKSQGELKIKTLLRENNILFEKEKQFSNCVYSKKNTKPRFDFYVNNQYLIEYDGRQHFEADDTGWNTKEQLEITKARDAFKNNWCKEHNIPLIRIPYTHYNNLCIEDLKLETSSFIVK